MICPTCGAEVPNGMSVCLECGAIVGSVQKTNDDPMFLQGQANREKESRKNMLRGMSGSLNWLTKALLAQVIMIAIEMLTALSLFALLSNPSRLFSTSGYNTLEFLTKLSEYLIWGQIAVTAVTAVVLYLLSNYGRGFLIAAVFLLVGMALDFLSERETRQSIRLAMDLGGIACEIGYAVFLFLQMAKVSEPFDKSVAEGWRGLLFWFILTYIALAVLAYIMMFSVQTLKGVQLCLTISGALAVLIEAVIYRQAKKTYEVI
ncbi:MAG: zinc ribbon domain-containing protein [Lachnospiraceae bacterium]|nr:zinc ribbon domain-containing protein [Lachnospiraceae bacterium]